MVLKAVDALEMVVKYKIGSEFEKGYTHTHIHILVSDTKYIHIVVQSPPPSISRTLFGPLYLF